MIDPKLNEIPVERSTVPPKTKTTAPTEAEEAERLSRARAGLSIRDTIAGDTLLSVGSRGVDVSGVEAGAGAGAGSTMLTPGRSESPAPDIIPGVRSTGAAGDALTTTTAPETDISSETDLVTDSHGHHDHEVSARAYECWCERGQPHGSPEVDWHRAVEDIRERRRLQSMTGKTSAASA